MTTTEVGPYAQVAGSLWDAGWKPIPVRGKYPPETGWTEPRRVLQ